MPVSERKLKIVVVDDHSVVREGLCGLIHREPDLVVAAQASSASEALAAWQTEKPDGMIVDLALGSDSGLDLIKRIREQDSAVPILVLSMHSEMHYAQRALRHGANGYVMKEEATSLLLAALREVLAGKIFVSPKMADRLLRSLSKPSGNGDAQGVESLSDRELEIFRLLGLGLGTTQIAAHLHISRKTVETHRARIKEKLGLDTSRDLVVRAANWVEAGARGSPSPR